MDSNTIALVSAFFILILRSFWHLIHIFLQKENIFCVFIIIFFLLYLLVANYAFLIFILPWMLWIKYELFALYFSDKWVYNCCVVYGVSIFVHDLFFHVIKIYIKNFFIIQFRVLIALFYSFLCNTGDYSPLPSIINPRLCLRLIMNGLGE